MIIDNHRQYDIRVTFLILTSAQKQSSKSLEIYRKLKNKARTYIAPHPAVSVLQFCHKSMYLQRMGIASHDSYKTKQAHDLGAELHGEAIVLLGAILVTSYHLSSRKEKEKECAQKEQRFVEAQNFHISFL